MMAGVQKRKIQWVISLLLVMLYFYSMPAQAQYGGGSGEPNDPYLIYTAEQMNAIGANRNDWVKHFKLMADIDLSGFFYDAALIAPDTNDATWEFDGTPFSGVFDGNGHVISNFTCISTEANYVGLFVFGVGLFGCVEGENAEIKNLELIDPNVDAGRAIYVGSLVGWLRWGTITNCYVEGGSVLGKDHIGGIVGHNSGTISDSYITIGVSGDHSVGGIAGYNNWGKIINCGASGSVTGSWYVGGMVGYNLGAIIDSYATAGVSGELWIGGMAGCNYNGRITSCCARGSVTGGWYVGGMVGSMSYDPYDPWWSGPVALPTWIFDSYSTGDVTGNRIVGGLVGGLTNSTITNCYSTGSVSGNDDVGGLVGAIDPPPVIGLWGFTPDTISDFYSTADITGNSGVGQIVISEVVNSFWDVETTGRATSAGGTGKSTVEMQTASTFLAAGWDFVDETENGTEDIWWILEGQDYPKLMWELLRLQPLRAFSPNPEDGATDVTPSPILHWAPAEPTLQHDIYIGEDKEEVANATTLSLGIYRGRQPGELTTYEPGKLEWDVTYYWRIDEVNEADPNSLCKGSVWGFTTANFLIVDDFESYNRLDPADPNSNSIFDTWIAVLETTTIELDVCGHPLPSFPVNGKFAQWSPNQVMNYKYHNSGPVYYSEATANITNLAIGQDWIIEGDGVLSLWFHGSAYNAPEPMYVAVANANGPTAVVYHDNPDALLVEDWTEWTIDLTKFSDQGVNLANVDTISIGFGDKNNLQAGGSSGVFFDDIRLYRPRPLPAFSPDPQDGATDVIQSPILHWVPAEPTLQHDIYFGEDKETVANATTESPGIYCGRQPGEMTTYDPGTLEWGKTYYWRIDEYNTDAAISKGNVWSFTTTNFLVVDDFEDYNERIFDFWIDGWGTPTNGSTVSILSDIDPYFNPDLWGFNVPGVHGGEWSMACFYDNTTAKYSEATMTLVWPRNWTQDGVGVLSLWFNGDPDNAPEPMYVALANVNGPPAMVYHDNPDAALIEAWTEWRIDLQAFADQGVDLTKIDTISIGLGDKNNPQADGSGLVFFDDIRLYRPQEPEPAP